MELDLTGIMTTFSTNWGILMNTDEQQGMWKSILLKDFLVQTPKFNNLGGFWTLGNEYDIQINNLF